MLMIIAILLFSFAHGSSFHGALQLNPDWSCMLEDSPFAGLKKLNESCNSTADCLNGGGPVICGPEHTCQCAAGFYAEKASNRRPVIPFIQISDASMFGDNSFCRPLPTLLQPCTTQCATPLKCVDSENSGRGNGRPGTGRGIPRPPRPEIFDGKKPEPIDSDFDEFSFDSIDENFSPWFSGRARRTCRCIPPYQLINFKCELACNDTEFYADGKCHKRCEENEVQLDNHECKSRSGLGENCEADEQCMAAYSECLNGKCFCRPGFERDGKTCNFQVANCEFGEPLRNAGGGNGSGLVSCTVRGPTVINFNGGELFTVSNIEHSYSWARMTTLTNANEQPAADDDANPCPADYYCQSYDNPVTGSSAAGFCCPKPKKSCPVGAPHPNANCTTNFALAIVGIQGVPGEGCPAKTHYCYQKTGSPMAACCPRACPQGMVMANGQCMTTAEIGGKCQANEQCSGNGVCANGTCSCPDKTELIEERKFCRAICEPMTEVNFNNKCYARKKLSDPCRGQEYRCPMTGYCGRRGVCQCPCGTVRINDTFCAPPPICPGDQRNTNSGQELASVFGQFLGNGHQRGGRNGRRRMISNRPQTRSAQEVFDNSTLCKVDGKNAPMDRAVDQCPDDQACMPYLEDMGVCCPQPEPFCPNGQEPGSECTSSEDCDEFSSCFTYAESVKNGTQGRICCPRSSGFSGPRVIGEDFFFGDRMPNEEN